MHKNICHILLQQPSFKKVPIHLCHLVILFPLKANNAIKDTLFCKNNVDLLYLFTYKLETGNVCYNLTQQLQIIEFIRRNYSNSFSVK